ncbi:type VI secretion system-associated FHA domain protein TagH [Methylocella sp.]|uniref:type VI secretion system-associated FHA domain protein TagH n=1 Tax=Methylocella sp. TaxID=1978226 RepID=UPI0037846CC3
MTLTLTIENEASLANGAPTSVSLTDGRGVDIGRSAGVDWPLPDPTRFISGRHCEIRFREGAYWLNDISTNGTFLNDSPRRVQSPHRLRDGDRVAIGSYVILVALDEPAEAPAPRAGTLWPNAAEPLIEPGPGAPLDPIIARQVAEAIAVETAAPPSAAPPDEIAEARQAAEAAGKPFTMLRPRGFFPRPDEARPEAQVQPEVQPEAPPEAQAPPEADLWADPDPARTPFAPGPQDDPWAETSAPGFSSGPAARAAGEAPAAEAGRVEAQTAASLRVPEPEAPEAPEGQPRPFDARPPDLRGPDLRAPDLRGPDLRGPDLRAAEAASEPEPAHGPAAPLRENLAAPEAASPEPAGAHAEAAAGAPSAEDFLKAFARGAGMPEHVFSRRDPLKVGEEMGALMRRAVEDMTQLLKARSHAKGFARASSQTMIQAVDNNPLKFAPTPEDALKIMFGPRTAGYLDARRAFEAAFLDLKAHQISTYAAMRQAARMLVEDLDPREIEAEAGSDGALAALFGGHKARLWDVFLARWRAKSLRHEDGLVDAFMLYFSQCYDDAKDGG